MLEADAGKVLMKIDAQCIFKKGGNVGPVILGHLGQILQGQLLGIVLLHIGRQPSHQLFLALILGLGCRDLLGGEPGHQGHQQHFHSRFGPELGSRACTAARLQHLAGIEPQKPVALFVPGLGCGETVREFQTVSLFHKGLESRGGEPDHQSPGIGPVGKGGMAHPRPYQRYIVLGKGMGPQTPAVIQLSVEHDIQLILLRMPMVAVIDQLMDKALNIQIIPGPLHFKI